MNLPETTQRIQLIIDRECQGVVRQMAERLSRSSYQSLNRLFLIDRRNNRYPNPSIDILQDISESFGISLEWLANGTGLPDDISRSLPEERGETRYLPFVNRYGYAAYATNHSHSPYLETLPLIPFVIDRDSGSDYMAFEVKGDSMDDGSRASYVEGDIVVGHEIDSDVWRSGALPVDPWDFVVVTSETVWIRRIAHCSTARQTITLRPLNPMYPETVVPWNEVTRLFNIVLNLQRRRR